MVKKLGTLALGGLLMLGATAPLAGCEHFKPTERSGCGGKGGCSGKGGCKGKHKCKGSAGM